MFDEPKNGWGSIREKGKQKKIRYSIIVQDPELQKIYKRLRATAWCLIRSYEVFSELLWRGKKTKEKKRKKVVSYSELKEHRCALRAFLPLMHKVATLTALLNDIWYGKTYTIHHCGQSPQGTVIRHEAEKEKSDITILRKKNIHIV